jgi:hypothetical protein
MEMNRTEVKQIADVAGEAEQRNLQDLSDLQLALVGGGVGEVVLA